MKNRTLYVLVGVLLLVGILLFAVIGLDLGSETKDKLPSGSEQKTEQTEDKKTDTEKKKSEKSDDDKADVETQEIQETEKPQSEGNSDTSPELITREEGDTISRETAKELVQPENEAFEEGLITCRRFSRFSGQYVEDGRDELVENVAAILVTNNGEQYLDFAALEYEIDGHEALFVATGLPPGTSAWVMEMSKLTIGSDAKFTYKGCADAYRADVKASTKKLKLTPSGNMLKAENQSSETMYDVCVYYKRCHTDGNYFGGITYVVNFGEMKPGDSLEKLAGHFDEENTEIVRISWRNSEQK